MIRKQIFKVGLIMAAPLLMSGCIDDNYDLSNIDTTSEFQVKDLVLPMNIDEILLKNIIDVDGNEQIKIVDDGYVFIEEGNFSSDNISIPKVVIEAPVVEPVISTVEIASNIPGLLPKDIPSNLEIHYPIKDQISDFSYETHSVSDFIVEIDKVSVDMEVEIKFSISGLEGIVESFTMRNFSLQVPKGLSIEINEGHYDSATGVLTLDDKKYFGNELSYSVKVLGIDIETSGIEYNHNTHTILFADKVGIHSGEVVVTAQDFNENSNILDLPKTIDLTTNINMSDLIINTFTGKIMYTLDGLSIAPVSLENVPELLSQDETNIIMSNPQVYMKFNNPLAQYSLQAQAGVTIVTHRDNSKDQKYTLDNDFFVISGNPDNHINTLCMSPTIPDNYYAGYEDATHVPYSSLSYLLSGKGLPKTIEVKIDSPTVPVQHVENISLGQDLGKINGQYTFFAPLDIKSGSAIVYTSTEKGWNDEDIDAITIKTLKVEAYVTNNLPLDITMWGYPVDVNGERINNVAIDGIDIAANTVDKPMTIFITGEITHLDGITFQATAIAPSTGADLKPSEYIHLKDMKVTISGNYIKKL